MLVEFPMKTLNIWHVIIFVKMVRITIIDIIIIFLIIYLMDKPNLYYHLLALFFLNKLLFHFLHSIPHIHLSLNSYIHQIPKVKNKSKAIEVYKTKNITVIFPSIFASKLSKSQISKFTLVWKNLNNKFWRKIVKKIYR